MDQTNHQTNFPLLNYFVLNRVACNLLTLLALLFGLVGMFRLNVQFLPSFEPDLLLMTVTWPGATSQEVHEAVVKPIQSELLGMNNLVRLEARANAGRAVFEVEFSTGVDLDQKLNNCF